MPKKELHSPSSAATVVKTSMQSVEKRRRARMASTPGRARMGVDSTPEGPGSRKRSKTASNRSQHVGTRVRTLKDMLNTVDTNKPAAADPAEPKAAAVSEAVKRVVNAEESGKESGEDSQPGSVVVAKKASVTAGLKSGPSPRWGHTMCLLTESEAVVIGGQGGHGDKHVICKDAIWHLDIAKGTWDKPDTEVAGSGPKPDARMGHTAVYDPTMRAVYVYGGSKNIKWYSDVHVLCCQTWKWSPVKANGKAPTRAYHSTTLYRHELWIFGGVYPRPDPQPDGCSNTIHVYSPIEESWYDPIVMGDKPAARSGHSCTLLGDRLVMFGGWDAPAVFNDLHVIDLVILEWTKPEIGGKPPTPRSWHASTALSGNRVLIHGGYNGSDALADSFIFNLDMRTWTEVKLEPPLTPRAGHTCLCLPYKHDIADNDQVLIFGGGDNEGSWFQDLIDVLLPWEQGCRPITG